MPIQPSRVIIRLPRDNSTLGPRREETREWLIPLHSVTLVGASSVPSGFPEVLYLDDDHDPAWEEGRTSTGTSVCLVRSSCMRVGSAVISLARRGPVI